MELPPDTSMSHEDLSQVQAFKGLLPLTPILVDDFTASSGASIHFLSHFHADHYPGLSSGWNHGIIYCSETTRNLVYQKFPGLKPSVVVRVDEQEPRVLDYGTWFIHMTDHATERPSRIAPSDDSDEILQVTLFPAQHCPGSVIFIFEGYFGKYVYTGDSRLELSEAGVGPLFRADLDDESEIPWSKMEDADRLFLDTTFAEPLAEQLPGRLEAVEAVIALIRGQPKDKKVLLECDMLGTEQVLIGVAEFFAKKVYAEPKLLAKLMAVPGLGRLLTSDPSCTRFWAVQHGTFSKQNLDRVASTKDITRSIHTIDAVFIKPSTQWFTQNSTTRILNHLPEKRDGVWHVLYSIHSSFGELKQFVRRIRPRNIKPLVSISASSLAELESLCGPSTGTSNHVVPEKIAALIGSTRLHAGISSLYSPTLPRPTSTGFTLRASIPAVSLLDEDESSSANASLHLSVFEATVARTKDGQKIGTLTMTDTTLDPDRWHHPVSNLRCLFDDELSSPETNPSTSTAHIPISQETRLSRPEKAKKLHKAPDIEESLFEAISASLAAPLTHSSLVSSHKKPKLDDDDSQEGIGPSFNLFYDIPEDET